MNARLLPPSKDCTGRWPDGNNNQQKDKMKTTKLILTGVCLAVVALCAPSGASAKAKASPTPEAAASTSPMAGDTMAKSPRAIPFRGKVASADATAKTFTIANKKGDARVIKITAGTKIMKAGAAATMADIVADEEVRGSYWKKEDGSLEAKKVNLGPKTDAEKAMKHAKKEKMMEASPLPTP